MPKSRRYTAEAAVDTGYNQRQAGGIRINWAAVGVICALIPTMLSFVWMAATQNAAINANHLADTTAITASNAAIAQLQADTKEQGKQTNDIVVHLTSIDQTLKTIMTYGLPPSPPRELPVGTGNTIIQQAPASDGGKLH